MSAADRTPAFARVMDAADALADELIAAVADAVRIRSVNPAYPGQDYDAVLGGETEVSRFMADQYRAIGCEWSCSAPCPAARTPSACGVAAAAGAR